MVKDDGLNADVRADGDGSIIKDGGKWIRGVCLRTTLFPGSINSRHEGLGELVGVEGDRLTLLWTVCQQVVGQSDVGHCTTPRVPPFRHRDGTLLSVVDPHTTVIS